MNKYSDAFLNALGAWQRGWREDKSLRLSVTEAILIAIRQSDLLPPEAFQVQGPCFRKRFLIPNNPQNNGDLVPLFCEGQIDEGVASWTTDYNYAKSIFKADIRPNTFAAIFRHSPNPSEVILNISVLWNDNEFGNAVNDYAERNGEHSDALLNFKKRQSEVILNAPLMYDDVYAFCERLPSFEELCRFAENEGTSFWENEDEAWTHMVNANVYPHSQFWIEGDAAKRANERVKHNVEKQIKELEGRSAG